LCDAAAQPAGQPSRELAGTSVLPLNAAATDSATALLAAFSVSKKGASNTAANTSTAAAAAAAAISSGMMVCPTGLMQLLSPAASAGLDGLAGLLPMWSLPLAGSDELRQVR
jgi:hypothetical protein